jgi:hypothetical protein
MPYYLVAVAYLDGAHGQATQIRKVVYGHHAVGKIDTGIEVVWHRTARGYTGETTVTFEGKEYATPHDAIKALEERMYGNTRSFR